MRKRAHFLAGLTLAALLATGAAARAQILIERTVEVNRTLGTGSALISGMTYTDANLSSISYVAVTLNFSSPNALDPIVLSDLSSILRYGTTTDSGGVFTNTVFSQGTLTVTNPTINFATQFDNLAPKTSERWELRVTDNVSGGTARLNNWTLSLQGIVNTNGTLTLKNGEKITTVDGSTVADATVGSVLAISTGTNQAVATAGETLTLAGGISGSGILQANTETNGTVILSGSSTNFTGTVQLTGSGTTELANTNALGSGNLVQTNAGSTLRLSVGGTLTNQMTLLNVLFATNGTTLSGAVTVNNTEFTVNSGDTNTVSGAVDGAGTMTKLGGGTLVLSGTNNSYTGWTDIQNGFLRALTVANSSNNSSIGAGTELRIGSSATAGTFVFTGTNTTNSMNRQVLLGSAGSTFSVEASNARVTLTGTVTNLSTNAATLTKGGAGTLELSGTNNSYTGGTDVQNGTLRAATLANANVNSSIGAGTSLTIGSGSTAGTMVFTGTSATNSTDRQVSVGSAGGTFSVEHSNSRVTLTGSVTNLTSGSTNTTLTKAGTGTLALSGGTNSVSVNTIAVQQGTLLLGAANAIGNSTAITMAGGTLDTGGYADNVGRLSITGNSTISGLKANSAGDFVFSDIDLSTYAGGGGSTLTLLGSYAKGDFIRLATSDFANGWDGATTQNFVSKIQFGNPMLRGGGISFGGGFATLSVIPEPRVYVGAGLLCLLIAVAEIRRRRKRGARA